ncbi:hypothetical protein K1728_01840 [Weissella confusa]|uniref:hypothetical protein n=1 Tax=Weissella confusa TaxID=1583 RepID=UPI001C6FA7C3|nr:hypothetical protein [Weissella confusa]QYU58179.1 hypothetical protein K1728_01840 [Weissella confusa]
MDDFIPVMISPKQLVSIFIVQGIENLYDEELADQLGTSVEGVAMLRASLNIGIRTPPWLASNIRRFLMEKAPLLETTKRVMEGEHGGI